MNEWMNVDTDNVVNRYHMWKLVNIDGCQQKCLPNQNICEALIMCSYASRITNNNQLINKCRTI